MSTLMKRTKRNEASINKNRLVTPWSNSFLRPWGGRLFTSNMDNLKNLMRFDDIFRNDFLEDNSLIPALNVKEYKTDFEIEFAAPGFNKKDFKITIEEDVLHVSGEKEFEEAENEDAFSRKEFCYKSFKRSMILPTSIDLDQEVKANYKNGILKVKLLKKEIAIEQIPKKKVIQVD
ncbi:MAG: Hsp20/alpha crystallin family protein [Winogradskyella sp.]|nr:Hsp20/alpha crystallin family protein [Winogradskyella sp.]